MRNNVRKKMRLICLLFAMVLLAGVPAAAKDRKNQKAAAENVVKKEMARGAKNARQEDRFLNEIISLFVLNARKSKNALNAKIIEVIPNEISIAFLSLLK